MDLSISLVVVEAVVSLVIVLDLLVTVVQVEEDMERRPMALLLDLD